jgi:hypothetical protein
MARPTDSRNLFNWANYHRELAMSHWGKLTRAHEHLEVVRLTIERFLQMKPYRLVREYKPQPPFSVGSRIECNIIFNAPADPPLTLPAVIGDCLTNLRASLDHLVYDIAYKNTNGNLTSIDKIQFPIYADSKRLMIFSGKCWNDLPPEVWRLIENLQPYQGCDDLKFLDHHLGKNPLWVLNLLVNTDKHRTFVTVPQVFIRDLHAEVRGGKNTSKLEFTISAPFKHGEKVHSLDFRATDPDAEVTLHPNLSIEVAFGDEWPTGGRPVLGSLHMISDHIRNEVFPVLEPFL